MSAATEQPDRASNREHWLRQAAQLICAFHLEGQNAQPRHPYRVTCGLTKRQRRDAVATPRAASADGTNEIFISPHIDDAPTVLRALTQGLIRAAHDGKKPSAAACAASLTDATRASDAVTSQALDTVLAAAEQQLGPYPHAALTSNQRETGSRLKKCQCNSPDCGAIWYASRKQAAKFYWCPTCGSRDLTLHLDK